MIEKKIKQGGLNAKSGMVPQTFGRRDKRPQREGKWKTKNVEAELGKKRDIEISPQWKERRRLVNDDSPNSQSEELPVVMDAGKTEKDQHEAKAQLLRDFDIKDGEGKTIHLDKVR